jgi:phosphoesterase RecJ-like protein
MDVAGQLIEKKIPFSELIDGVFYRKTLMQNQLLGRCLMDSKTMLDHQLIVSVVSKETMAAFGAVHSDLEGVIDQLRVTDGIEVAMLVSETSDHVYKFSLRSNQIVDVNQVAQAFGGGGHIRAAGFTASGEAEKLIVQVEKLVKEQLTSCTME